MKAALGGFAAFALVTLAVAGCSRTGDHTDTTGPAGNAMNPATVPAPDPSATPNTIPSESAAGLNSNRNPNDRGTVGSGTSEGNNDTSTSRAGAPNGR